jgi:phage shock protein C
MVAKPRPRELYRDPVRGKVAGVCAGIGRYFDWPVWPIRLGFVLLAVFTQVFPLVAAYLIAWFVLDPVSDYSPPGLRGRVDGWFRHTRSRWDQAESMPEDGMMDEPAPVEPAQPATRTHQVPPQTMPVWPVQPVAADSASIEAAFAELELRVQQMERHVTEPAFVLRQQFRSL